MNRIPIEICIYYKEKCSMVHTCTTIDGWLKPTFVDFRLYIYSDTYSAKVATQKACSTFYSTLCIRDRDAM